MNRTAAEILSDKDQRLVHLKPSQPICEALALLEFEDVGALVVSKRGKKVDGIISERDVVRALRYYGAEIFDRTVEDLMTSEVITCSPSTTRGQAAALMQEYDVRHLPVVENGQFAGVISVQDVSLVEDADLLRITPAAYSSTSARNAPLERRA